MSSQSSALRRDLLPTQREGLQNSSICSSWMLPFLDSHVGALPEKQIEHVGGQTWDVKSPHLKASVGHYQSEVKGLFIVGPEYKVGIQGFPRGVLAL